MWLCLLSPQYYKKTKQLPVLVKCCEEIQPHEWKPPVEREEHRLPFWLKVFSAALRPGLAGSCCLVHFLWVLLEFCEGFPCGIFLGGMETIPVSQSVREDCAQGNSWTHKTQFS